ncbi:MAG TPA: hypothetical protein VIY71_06680 [Solirubrobacterales bacterium]
MPENGDSVDLGALAFAEELGPRPEDRIPYYRFSAKAKLKGSGRRPPGGAMRSPRRCPTNPAI